MIKFKFMQRILMIIMIIFVHITGISQSYELKVNVTDIAEIEGTARIAVFTDADHFKDKVSPTDTAIIEIKMHTVSHTFKLIGGLYAIAVYQDNNNDGQLNTRALGIPTEGVGFSNLYEKKLRPPDFQESSFFLQSDTTIRIPIFYDKK